jgi:integrase
MLTRRSVVTIYVRHQGSCKYVNRSGRAFARDCDCVKWLRYSGEACVCHGRKHGPHRQHKLTAGTRSWAVAEDKRAELQRRLDTGETGIAMAVEPTAKRPTIAQEIETFIRAKQDEGRGHATIRKLRQQLGLFEQFMANRSKYFPSEITKTDVIEFRAGWNSWKSGRTRQKAQTNLRGFIRAVCKENQAELLSVLKTIKLSAEDEDRLAPKPFSEDELTRLLAQVPKTFADDPAKVARMITLIHFMVSTGCAIRDAVQLTRDNIRDGWLRIKRQKTRKPVQQKLDDALYRELLAVANSNPKYIFWNGTSRPTSATGLWQEDMRQVMKASDLWIKGNLFHRFRDTAVDFWLGEGCSVVEVAAMLGDTVTVVEKHYRDLLSKRLEARLAKVPTRSWAVAQ